MAVYKRNLREVESADISSDKALFGKNDFSYFVLKKAEKLTSALYLVTEHVPSTDPLRRKIRALGLDIMSFMVCQFDPETEKNNEKVLSTSVAELLSLLSLSVLCGYVSSMNRDVLDREYREVLYAFINDRDLYSGNIGRELEAGFFNIADNIKDTYNIKHFNRDRGADGSKGQIDHQHSLRKSRKTGGTKTLHRYSQPEDVSRKDRRGRIVRIIKQKGRISIKDISNVVTGCSEKTIQRELLALVNDGILRKEGKKRWSTYVVV